MYILFPSVLASPLSTSRIKMAKLQKDKKVGTILQYTRGKKEREKREGGGSYEIYTTTTRTGLPTFNTSVHGHLCPKT